jgi:Zn-dependent protease with chaperone function
MRSRTKRVMRWTSSSPARNGLAERLTSRVTGFFHELGHADSTVEVHVVAASTILAGAQGLVADGVPRGRIFLHAGLIRALSDEELDFVLAHEVAHIHCGHNVATATLAATRAIFDSHAQRDSGLRFVLTLWDVWRVLRASHGDLPPSAALTRSQELAADALAVKVTGKPDVARAALSKLVGGNLDAPSHEWEVFDRKLRLPVFSMRERLARLTP